MNFFQAQDRARHNTVLLVALFILAVAALIVGVYAVLFALLHADTVVGATAPAQAPAWFNSELFVYSGGGVLFVVAIGSGIKIIALSGGGAAVAESMGGKPVPPATRAPDERRLLNIVEEMSIASGAPMPRVYIIPDDGINAFAAGTKLNNAVIGVTRGALRAFNREQMQGVVAHEFSHIINGDMRLNIRLIAIIGGIALLGVLGHYALRGAFYSSLMRGGGRSRGGREQMAILALGLTLMVIGFLGAFFGNLIRAATSRQREYLADAAAVQFTRNPQGIASALQRIGVRSGVLQDKHAVEYAHMFFAPGAALGFANMLASHPPLRERIRRVMPNWDGNSRIGAAPQQHEEEKTANGGGAGTEDINRAFAAASGFAASAATERIGDISPAAVALSQQVRRALPRRLHDALEDSYSVRALIYCLLLDRKNETYRDAQLRHLQEKADAGVYDLVLQLAPQVSALSRRACLPLVQCALPALYLMSPSQCTLFIGNMAALIAADREVELFEWSIQAVLTHTLNNADKNTAAQPGDADIAYALSLLARTGQTDAPAAYAAATAKAGIKLGFVGDAFAPQRLFAAMQRLANAKPRPKKIFVDAAAACVAHDGVINENEEALLRAYLMILECPLPACISGAE